jgi:exopolysaccharide biosynthesis WecB/TagA/CpsF family protein
VSEALSIPRDSRIQAIAPSSPVSTRRAELRSLELLGLPLLSGRSESVAHWLAACAADDTAPPTLVCHASAHNLFHLARGGELSSELVGRAQLLLDGIAAKLAARVALGQWPSDVNGTDLFPRVMGLAAQQDLSVYFLGGSKQVLEEAVQRTHAQFPGLHVAGHHPGYFSEAEEDRVAEDVRRSGARLVLIARGSPLRERFLLEGLETFGASLIWDVGGLFGFVSGEVPRAPAWLRRVRLEWAFRLVREPRRLWHRSIVVAPWLLIHALAQRLSRREPS